MQTQPVIIIGGGITGLIAARELLRHDKKVIILEAGDRLGGRIYTLYNQSSALEAGAEFIHGNLQVTLGLLKEYAIGYSKTGGQMIQIENGKIKKQHDFTEGWDKLFKQMGMLQKDMSFADFLSLYFSDKKYENLRHAARRYAEGFDAADTTTVSTLALYTEWKEEDGGQYRIDGGYKKLIDSLSNECMSRGCEINLFQAVKQIEWEENKIKLSTREEKEFISEKLIITVPLSVLQAQPGNSGYIAFTPSINQHLDAATKIGFGSVIKLLLICSKPFWNDKFKHAGFFITDQAIPTWWTQFPNDELLLTGWLAGPLATDLQNRSVDQIMELALQSLANMFEMDIFSVKSLIIKSHVFNWSNEPNIGGAYSFPMLETKNARTILNEPVKNTLFFAGEALYEDSPGGTVEAALISGIKTAGRLLKG